MSEEIVNLSQSIVNHSPTIGKIAAKLAEAQGKLRNPERNKEVEVKTRDGKYGFSYATLDSILDLCRPVLSEAGIALIQGVRINGSRMFVSTMLVDGSGEWVESAVAFPMPGTPQGVGSDITYGRRYTLCGLLGISAEEDDDANAATGNTVQASAERPARQEKREASSGGFERWSGKIVNLKESKGTNKTTGKPWTKFEFHGADGEKFTTFSQSMVDLLKKGGREMDWEILYEQTKYGKNLEELKPLDRLEDEEPPPF